MRFDGGVEGHAVGKVWPTQHRERRNGVHMSAAQLPGEPVFLGPSRYQALPVEH